MVEVNLTLEEYEIIEKWFGLLYGNDKSKRKPSREDLQLFEKLGFMHISILKARIDESEDDYTWGKDDY